MFTKAEIVAVSDIHIRHPADVRSKILVNLINQCAAAQVPCFALLGDIFDFCLGDGSYFQKKYREIGTALESLAASGTHVVFIEGNHEFNMVAMQWQGVNFVSETMSSMGHTWISPSGKRIVMSHGDFFHAPDAYLWFRKLIKSKATLYGVSKLPGIVMDTYALNHARASRSRDQYRTIDETKILGDAAKLALTHDADYLLFGHFHRPWAEPIVSTGGNAPGDRLMLCMPSWEQPNLLLFDGNQFHRAFLSEDKSPLEFSPAQSGS